MKLLKLMAVLLDYPSDDLWSHGDELRAAADDLALSPQRRQALVCFVDTLLASDILHAQERWLTVFDRGRAMSLLLFEHIHGESRDRGQAMVDLLTTYRNAGFDLGVKQLPDYLPVILEYLSLRPIGEVSDWLGHIGHILELLTARAQQRNTDYVVLLEALVELATGDVDLGLLQQRVINEERDDTVQAIDKVWEEEAIRFGVQAPAENCAPPTRLPSGAKPVESKVIR